MKYTNSETRLGDVSGALDLGHGAGLGNRMDIDLPNTGAEVSIAEFTDSSGKAQRLSVLQRPEDGSHVLYASSKLPDNWTVQVEHPGSEADVTDRLNGYINHPKSPDYLGTANMVDATSFVNSNFTLRGRLDGLINPERRMLAISPGAKVTVSMTDENGLVTARNELIGSPIMSKQNFAELKESAVRSHPSSPRWNRKPGGCFDLWCEWSRW